MSAYRIRMIVSWLALVAIEVDGNGLLPALYLDAGNLDGQVFADQVIRVKLVGLRDDGLQHVAHIISSLILRTVGIRSRLAT